MRKRALHQSRQFFLASAGLSFVASVFCWFLVDRDVGLFIGLWVPSILSLGAFLQFHLGDGRR